jgi:histone methylation protein DOT1
MIKRLTDPLRNACGQARCRIFDWRHGVRTCGDSKLADLTIVGNNTDHGGPYHPSHPKFLFEVLSSLNIDYPSHTFVDIGSGKGRVLLIASEMPFSEIIGVEFATELHEIACQNIRRYRSKTQKCKNVKSLNRDAMEFELPLRPLVLYFFNPFRPPVWVPVLQRLQRSLDSHPREVTLIYEAPFHAGLIEQHTALRCVEKSIYHNTYRFEHHS